MACLRDLRQVLLERPQALMLLPHPELANMVVATVEAARSFLERALSEARLQLRPEVDVRASAIMLQALVFTTVAWQQEPRLRLQEREWDRLFESSVRPLVRGL